MLANIAHKVNRYFCTSSHFFKAKHTSPPIVVNGKQISKDVLREVKQRVLNIRERVDIRMPRLAIILVGNAADSLSYVKIKEKSCKRVGVVSELIHLAETTTQQEVLDIVNELNQRDDVDSILTQLPFPAHISRAKVINSIVPDKDVDGLQKCFQTQQLVWDDKNNRALPCTPQSCLHILDVHRVNVKGKQVVMLGKGLLVGHPLSALLLGRGAILRMCDKNTDISEALKDADIIVSATGVRQLVKGEQLKPGVVIIDVGCSRPLPHEDQTSVVGDVEFESAILKASLITPVPGGVGPVTVSMLIQNVVNQWIRNHEIIIKQQTDKNYLESSYINTITEDIKQNKEQSSQNTIKENTIENEKKKQDAE